jgi:hypothetical protein
MSKDAVMVWSQVAWCGVFWFMFLQGLKGYSTWPRFSMWFGGALLALNLMFLGAALEKWSSR